MENICRETIAIIIFKIKISEYTFLFSLITIESKLVNPKPNTGFRFGYKH